MRRSAQEVGLDSVNDLDRVARRSSVVLANRKHSKPGASSRCSIEVAKR